MPPHPFFSDALVIDGQIKLFPMAEENSEIVDADKENNNLLPSSPSKRKIPPYR